MSMVTVEGFDIDVVQTLTEVRIEDARSVERNDDGITWNGRIMLVSGNAPLGNSKLRQVLQNNTYVSNDELEAKAQEVYSKGYDLLVNAELTNVQGQCLGASIISAINEADVGITPSDVELLVSSVVSQIG